MSLPLESHGEIDHVEEGDGELSPTQLSATERLVEVAQQLSTARDLEAIMLVAREAGRALTGAEGATFVLREGNTCFYAEESAIGPLWKGRRFPISECVSGWAMLNREPVIIEDVLTDPRVPHDAYRPTFVKSLAVVPIRTAAPVGAIGSYWRSPHLATSGEVKLLSALADLISVAMENVQLYGELQKRIREAQDAVQVRDEFIIAAAHELRTPLTAMLLQLQRLEKLSSGRSPATPATIQHCATRSLASATRLAGLVDGLVDASQVPHGRLQLNFERFDLADSARAVVARFAGPAKRTGSELAVAIEDSLVGRWDRVRIEQVITNLLSNALKFGAGKPVELTLERRPPGVCLEIRDHGPGIAPDIAGRIFERFARAGSVSHYAGLGLGLYVARAVIEAHGGTISFETGPNQGCTFMVRLPFN